MAVTAPAAVPRPWWPADPFDAARVRVGYYPPADELTLFFGGKSVPAVCDPIDAFDGDIAVMYDAGTGEIVGIQGIPFLLGAVRHRPAWAALAWGVLADRLGEETLRAALPGFIAEVAEAFACHGIGGIPVEEFAAAIREQGGQPPPE